MPKPSLSDARLYLCTDGRRDRGDLADFLDAVLAAGVDIVQLREKGLEAREELALLEVFRDACDRHGRLLAVNDRADIAYAARPDVLHLGQDDLPVTGRARDTRRRHPHRTVHPLHRRGVRRGRGGGRRLLLLRPDLADADQARPARARAAAAPARGVAGQRTGRGSASAASTWATWTRSGRTAVARVVVVRAITDAEDPGRRRSRVRQAAHRGPARLARSAGRPTLRGARPYWPREPVVPYRLGESFAGLGRRAVVRFACGGAPRRGRPGRRGPRA